MTEPRRCPLCGSARTTPIVYGLPGDEMLDEAQRGEIILGGCCIVEDQATHECRSCSAKFLWEPDEDEPNSGRVEIVNRTPSAEWVYPIEADAWSDEDYDEWDKDEAEDEAAGVRLAGVVADAEAAGENVADAIMDTFGADR